MNQLDHRVRRPERLLKLRGVRDDELLDIHDIGDEKQIDEEKASEDPVHPAP